MELNYTQPNVYQQNLLNPLVFEERWLPLTKKVHPEIKEGIYLISSYGRVWSINRKIFKVPEISNAGYYRVHLMTDNYKKAVHITIHRAMMIEFCPIPNPEKFVVNHIDGNKLNNVLWNLEWVTMAENSLFGYKESMIKQSYQEFMDDQKDYKSYKINIPDEDIQYIQSQLKLGRSLQSIVNETRYPIGEVNKVKLQMEGRVPNQYNLKYNRYGEYRLTFTDEEVHAICKYFEDHKNVQYPAVSYLFRDCLYELFGIDYDKVMYKTMSYYYDRKYRKDITDLYDY